MKKWTTAVLLMFLAIVLGIGIWYFFQRDYHPAFHTAESAEEPQSVRTTSEEAQSEVTTPEESEPAEADPAEMCKLPKTNEWGVILTAADVTPDGMTLVCTQSGGTPTGELSTGAWYEIETYEGGQWKPLPMYAEVCWKDIAWIIPPEETTEWQVNWTWIYGTLSPGEYRITKEIMDFRQTGDFDTCRSYAYFTIE